MNFLGIPWSPVVYAPHFFQQMDGPLPLPRRYQDHHVFRHGCFLSSTLSTVSNLFHISMVSTWTTLRILNPMVLPILAAMTTMEEPTLFDHALGAPCNIGDGYLGYLLLGSSPWIFLVFPHFWCLFCRVADHSLQPRWNLLWSCGGRCLRSSRLLPSLQGPTKNQELQRDPSGPGET